MEIKSRLGKAEKIHLLVAMLRNNTVNYHPAFWFAVALLCPCSARTFFAVGRHLSVFRRSPT
jgi:hypothetical protein